jgi:CspA family cold shock protein
MEGFRTLKQGSKVNYELIQGPKGQLAQKIFPVDVAAQRVEDQPSQSQPVTT